MPGDGNRDFGGPPVPDDLEEFLNPRKKIVRIVVVCGLILLVIAGAVTVADPLFVKKRLGIGLPYGVNMDVSEPKLSGTKPTATFKIYYGWFGIDSNQTGGACLVADVASLLSTADVADKGIYTGGSCTSNEQCMTHCANEPQCDPKAPADPTDPTQPANPSVPRQKWWGYCAPEPGKSGKRCWYKPEVGGHQNEPQLCEKTPYYGDVDPLTAGFQPKIWNANVDNPMPHVDATTPLGTPFDMPGFYRDYTGGKPARWRLIGLLSSTNGPPRIVYGKPACLKTSKGPDCAKP